MKYLLFLAAVISASVTAFASGGSGGSVNIAAGTKVVARGNVFVSSNSSFFINDGTYTDTTGTLNVFAGLSFSGTGTTSLRNIVINNGGTTMFNALVSVYNTATIAAGTVYAGSGNLYIRSDVNSSANLVNNGVLEGTVRGLVTKASAATGGCPSYSSTLALNISGSSMQYQWQSSTDSATWTDVTGATSSTYVATVSSSMYYRCSLSTTNSSYAQYTPGVKLAFTGEVPALAVGSNPVVSLGTTSANLPYTASGSPTTYSVAYSSEAIGAGFSNVSSASLSGSYIVLAVPSAAPAAVYTGTLTVSNGCTSNGAPFTVTVVSSFDATIASTNVTCNGGNDGAATITVLGGTTPYSYSWAPSGGTGATATGLAAGTYTVTITDATADVISRTVTITQPAAINITGTQVDVTCNGGNSGSATVTVSGGAGAYSYYWSPGGSTVATATGLFAGTYTCSVTSGGCLATHSFTIAQPTAMSITATHVNVTCNGGSDGAATVSVTGGTGSHYYYWSPAGGTAATATGLSAGTYTCVVTDDNGCVGLQTATITQPSAITITGTQVNVTCNGGSDGAATVTVVGGAGAYSYYWSPGGSTLASATGLSAGTYTCTVVDGTGCTKLQSFTIAQPSAITITGTQVNVTCNGGSNGSATVSVTGGTGAYSYYWSPGGSTVATATGLSAGTYTCTVIDGVGCTKLQTFTIAQPSAISISGSQVNVTCNGGNDGSATVTVTGGTGAYGYFWSPGGRTTPTATGLSAGAYTCSVTDGSGCLALQYFTITQPAPLPAISGSSAVCAGFTITLSNSVSGGTWSSSNSSVASVDAATGVVVGIAGGTMTITYTIGGDCGAFATKDVTVNTAPFAGTILGPSSVVAGSAITLSSTVGGGVWTASNGHATVNSVGIVTGVSVGSVTIRYSVTTACGSALTTKAISVGSAAGDITGTLTLCAGATTALSSTIPGGSWSSNNTAVATVSTDGIVAGIAPGVAAITYTTGSGAVAVVVTVQNTPTIITGTMAICVGKVTTLNNSATGSGTWSSSDTTIAAIGGNTGYVTGLSAGTTTITYVLSTGCLGTTVVTINALPATITGTAAVCSGSSATLSNATPGGSWSSKSTSVATVDGFGTVTGMNSGMTTITYALGTGCFTTTTATVYALPAAITGSTSVCKGATTNLGNTTLGGSWSSSDVTVAIIGSTGTVSGLGAGTSAISYTTGAGCVRSTVVTVNDAPAISGAASLCPGTTITLSSSVSGGAWSGGNSSIAVVDASGMVTGMGAGMATITYTTGSGCKTNAVVIVSAAPAAITGTMKACTGTSTTLSDATIGGTWSSSDITIATAGANTGVITGIAAGTVMVTYTSAAGCYRTTTVTINAGPAPIAGALSTCIGSTTALTDPTPGLSWSSSNTAVATIGATGVVTGVHTGTTTISYTAASTNCVATAEVTVNTTPGTISGPASGCVASTFTLTNSVPGGVWSSGNTAVATVDASTGMVTGVASGMAYITYSTGSGCNTAKSITINSGPTVSGYTTVCAGLTTTLSGGGYGTWSSSDPSVATIVASGGYVTGVSAGTAMMSFTSGGTGCAAPLMVTVIPMPGAIAGPTQACSGAVLTFTNSSPGGVWASSNNASATIGSATGIANIVGTGGSVIISYSFGSTCRVSTAITIKALPAVIGGTPTVCTPVTTTLTCTTSGGVWSSSDATVATVGTGISASYGIVTGVAAGTAEISYTIPSTGCARSAVVTVNPGLNAGTINSSGGFTLHTVSAPTSVTLSSTGATGGTWTSSNTAVATVNPATGVVTAVAAGTTTITYAVTASCTNIATKVITVTAGKAVGSLESTVGSLQIYPNPTTGAFTLVSDEAGILKVFSIDGKEITSYEVKAGINPLSLSDKLATGIYMCRFAGESGMTTIVRLALVD